MLDQKSNARKRAAPRSGPQPGDLLAWYDRHRRVLPWRAKPGEAIDPYRVWLSEIMLQQTTVKTVGPYFARFVARWPDVGALAAAPLDDVLRLWAGLGYYARARNLHACARAVAERGGFPRTEAELTTLPGIGRYTAAAIAAIAFDDHAVPVDGNVERVVTRLFAIEEELPAAKPEIQRLAQTLAPDARAGDFAQAMMDLGATICTPVKPACALCPWMDGLHGAAARRSADLSAQGAEAGRAAAARRGVRRGARRRLRAVAQPTAEGAARRHDRGADHGLVARFRRQECTERGAASVTRRAEVATPAGRGQACVHAFSAGACRLCGQGAAQCARA